MPIAHQHRPHRHSLLGHRHRRLRSHRRIHRRTVRALVPVRRLLPAVPLARPHLDAAPAVGLEQGEPSELTRRETPDYQPDASEYHNAAVEPICRKYLELRYRMLPYLYSAVRECTQTGMPMMRALWLHYPDDSDRRRARRRISLGPRHPGRAGGREGRDRAQGLSAARRLVRFLDQREATMAAARSRAKSISKPCRSTCAPARSSRWVR